MKFLVSDKAVNARQVALKVCFQVVAKGQSLTQQLEQQLHKLPSDRDKAFCSELSHGICRYYFVLQKQLSALLKKPLKAKDRDVQLVLLLGLYQIRFMRVEDHAAVNESVKLLRSIKKNWAKGLVNAILRSFIRQQSDLDKTNSAQLSAQEHALAYPQWIQKKLQQDWGDEAFAMMQAGNLQAPMVLRVDLSRISREDYLHELMLQKINAVPHPLIRQAVVLQKAQPVETLPGFEDALVSVQDASAQIAAQLLDCKAGMSVLDACAAPGGKTLHIMQSAPRLQVTALDKDATRLKRVEENLQRAGLDAKLLQADGSEPSGWYEGEPFDRILLDAPCSASGIIRRHPDIRLLRKAEDVSGLVRQQRALLNALWPLLKTGGLMVYSTCSIFKDENEHQLQSFVGQQANCVERIINAVQWGQPRPLGRQILPGSNNMDGFYYACLEKIA